ncbi:hypothetical protein GOP47_0008556 [Adiantum capillus-veneris]|uniref:C-terminal processing peptidase n=1 Tax=Adiantum capillus-veneris TaxID=13818 RepID=A0A9D4UZ30_ADICA|nr:hypothetical protein GOP47_0008556 [Adiantum capillus-veneris]
MASIGSTICAHEKHGQCMPSSDSMSLKLARHQLSYGNQGSFLCSQNRPPKSACIVAKAKVGDSTGKGPTCDSHLRHAVKLALRTAAASAAAAMLCFHGVIDAPALAESLTITFPASKIREVSTVQRTLIETWGLIRETYVDPTFNHQDWDSKLGETMSQILPMKTADAAYGKIESMLATLGDPFTRLVSPQEYQSFKIGSDGSLEGVGLLIATDRESGRLVVISSLDGGPAAKAGIHSGDELVEINDEKLVGMDGDKAASKLRGPAGTSVKLKFRREGFMEEERSSNLTEVKIYRENITLTPVFTAVLPHTAPDGHLAKLGYLRLTAFSQNAAADMERAISGLENEGAEFYILDLRNNPGGLVKAGLDVAQMWLDGDEVLVNTVDRDGNTLPISLANGHALTHDPLAILVNGGSASASEILAGALHDNGRAVLIGSKTYGKGKIQSVTELRDGSAVFVTVAKYLSPSLHEIDQVGIVPDVQCTPGDGGGPNKSVFSSASSVIEQDSCVLAAEHQLGIF